MLTPKRPQLTSQRRSTNTPASRQLYILVRTTAGVTRRLSSPTGLKKKSPWLLQLQLLASGLTRAMFKTFITLEFPTVWRHGCSKLAGEEEMVTLAQVKYCFFLT